MKEKNSDLEAKQESKPAEESVSPIEKPTPTTNPPQANKTSRIYLLVAILILISAGIGVGSYLSYQNYQGLVKQSQKKLPPQQSLQGIISSEQQEECSQLSYTNKTALTFLDPLSLNQSDSQKVLLTFGDIEYLAELTGETEEISEVQYNPAINMVAYIVGKDWQNSKPRKAILYSPETQDKKLVYELTTTSKNYGDYVVSLKDLQFPDDGTYLAVTTSDSLFIYDISKDTLTPKFYKPADLSNGHGMVFVYHPVAFSPNNSQILIREGYYEGSSYFIYDLNSGAEKPLNKYNGYFDEIYGWSENNLVVAQTNSNDQNLTNYLIVSPDQTVVSTLLANSLEPSYTTKYLDNTLFTRVYQKSPSGEYVCNNVAKKYEVTQELVTLVKRDVSSNQETELFQVDSTESSGNLKKAVKIVDTQIVRINNEDQIVVKLEVKQEMGYYLVTDNFNTLQPLQLSI